MSDQPELAPWEEELLNPGLVTPFAADEHQPRADETPPDPAPAQRAEQAARWPELHEPADGGRAEPGAVLDLTPLWPRLWDGTPETGGMASPPPGTFTAENLAEQAGGLARRLLAGLQSIRRRRDENFRISVEVDGWDAIVITVWSGGGCFSARAWWAQAKVKVSEDSWGEMRLSPVVPALVAVRGKGGMTTFQDGRGILAAEIIACWRGWEARQAIRERLGLPVYLPEGPLSLADWAEQQTGQVQEDERQRAEGPA